MSGTSEHGSRPVTPAAPHSPGVPPAHSPGVPPPHSPRVPPPHSPGVPPPHSPGVLPPHSPRVSQVGPQEGPPDTHQQIGPPPVYQLRGPPPAYIQGGPTSTHPTGGATIADPQDDANYPLVVPYSVGASPTVYAQTRPAGTRENYAAQQSIGLGGTQITVGLACIILQVVIITASSSSVVAGQGIWSGIFFILSGSFGVAAGRSKSTCLIITHMILSIVSAVFALCTMSPSGVGIRTDVDEDMLAGVIMNSLLLFLCFVEIVVAIWASAISCGVICCGPPPPRQPTGPVYHIQHASTTTTGRVFVISTSGPVGGAQFASHQPLPTAAMVGLQQESVYMGTGDLQAMGGAAQPISPPSYTSADQKPPAYTPTDSIQTP